MAEDKLADKEEPSLKRRRASEASEAEEPKLSKSQKKKQKKMKAESSGTAPPPVQEKKAVSEAQKEKVADEPKKEKKHKEKVKEGAGGEQASDKKGQSRALEGGVKIRDHKVGTDQPAKKGDSLSIRYIGKLEDGKVFDKNVSGKPVCCCTAPLEFSLTHCSSFSP